MGLVRGENSLWFATAIDNSGLKQGSVEAQGIIKGLASNISKTDVFGALGIGALLVFKEIAQGAHDMSVKFEHAMREVETISDATQANFEGMSQAIINIGTDVPQTSEELARGFYQIASAGYDGADGLKLLNTAARGAIGGVTDAETTADGLTTALNAWKIEAENVDKVMDTFFQTVKLGKTTIPELSDNLAIVAPLASSMGVELEQVMSAIATLTKQGTPTSVAFTQIRSSLSSMNKVLGDGWAKNMTYQEGLQAIADKAGGSQVELQKMVGRIEAANAILGLTGANANQASKDLEKIANSAGSADEAFNRMMKSSQSQDKLLSANIEAALKPLGDFLRITETDVTSWLNEAFKSGDIKEYAKYIGAITASLLAYKGTALGLSKLKSLNLKTNLKEIAALKTEGVELAKNLTVKEREKIGIKDVNQLTLEQFQIIKQKNKAKIEELTLLVQEQQKVVELATVKKQKNAEELININKEISISEAKLSISKTEKKLQEHNNLVEKKNILIKEEKILTTQIETATKKTNNAQTKLNTIQTQIATATDKKATIAKGFLTKASLTFGSGLKSVGAIIKANPLGALISVITMAIPLIDSLKNGVLRNSEAFKNFKKEVTDSEAKIVMLFDALKTTENGTKAHKQALDQINDTYGKYLPNLLSEESSLLDIEKAQKLITQALRSQIATRMQQQEIESAISKSISEQKIVTTELRESIEEEKSKAVASIAMVEFEEFIEKYRKAIYTVDEFGEAVTQLGIDTHALGKSQKDLMIDAFAEKYGIASAELGAATEKIISAQDKQKEVVSNIKTDYEYYIKELNSLDDNVLNKSNNNNDSNNTQLNYLEQLENQLDVLQEKQKAFSNLAKDGLNAQDKTKIDNNNKEIKAKEEAINLLKQQLGIQKQSDKQADEHQKNSIKYVKQQIERLKKIKELTSSQETRAQMTKQIELREEELSLMQGQVESTNELKKEEKDLHKLSIKGLLEEWQLIKAKNEANKSGIDIAMQRKAIAIEMIDRTQKGLSAVNDVLDIISNTIEDITGKGMGSGLKEITGELSGMLDGVGAALQGDIGGAVTSKLKWDAYVFKNALKFGESTGLIKATKGAKQYEDSLKEINKLIGEYDKKIKSLSGSEKIKAFSEQKQLLIEYQEQLEKAKEAEENASKKVLGIFRVKSTDKSVVGKLKSEIAEIAPEIEKLSEELGDLLSGGITEADIAGQIANAFATGKISVADFNSFSQKMLQDASRKVLEQELLNSATVQKAKKFLESAFYDENGNFNGLDDDEINQFKNLMLKAKDQAALIAEQLNLNNSVADQQANTLHGAIKKQLTEETGSILAGAVNSMRIDVKRQIAELNAIGDRLNEIVHNTSYNIHLERLENIERFSESIKNIEMLLQDNQTMRSVGL